MQQILNYTPKVERIHHQYQIQGEINKLFLSEDFYEKSEELKDKVNESDKIEQKAVKEKSEESGSSFYEGETKKKGYRKEKSEEENIEKESHIDIKV